MLDDDLTDEDRAEVFAETGAPVSAAATPERVATFQDVVDLVGRKRDGLLKVHLEENVSLVKFDATAGTIDIHLLPKAPKELGNHLREKLQLWTGRRWIVALSPRAGQKPVGQVERELAAAELESLSKHPMVAQVLRAFPGAKISSVKPMKK